MNREHFVAVVITLLPGIAARLFADRVARRQSRKANFSWQLLVRMMPNDLPP